jgi:hypothetical protein
MPSIRAPTPEPNKQRERLSLLCRKRTRKAGKCGVSCRWPPQSDRWIHDGGVAVDREPKPISSRGKPIAGPSGAALHSLLARTPSPTAWCPGAVVVLERNGFPPSGRGTSGSIARFRRQVFLLVVIVVVAVLFVCCCCDSALWFWYFCNSSRLPPPSSSLVRRKSLTSNLGTTSETTSAIKSWVR